MFQVILPLVLTLFSMPALAVSHCRFEAKAAAFAAVAKDQQESKLPISDLRTSIAGGQTVSATRVRFYVNAVVTEANDSAEQHVIVDVNPNSCKILSVEQGGF